jgi:hypothetical protein
MSMSMLHVHVNAAFHVNASWQCQCPLTYIYRNDGMPDCPASSQSCTGLKKITMPKPVRYRTKLTQSGIFLVWYQTKIRDAGMPMPAIVSSMPMPSYAYTYSHMSIQIHISVMDRYRYYRSIIGHAGLQQYRSINKKFSFLINSINHQLKILFLLMTNNLIYIF